MELERQCEQAFDSQRQQRLRANNAGISRLGKEIVIEADASNVAVAAVLSQWDEETENTLLSSSLTFLAPIRGITVTGSWKLGPWLRHVASGEYIWELERQGRR